ncbi:MAG: calcium sensor EFh [Pirellulaceae bacterium]|nr:calcium sensor EFh [Pirellulaceae bacterium]
MPKSNSTICCHWERFLVADRRGSFLWRSFVAGLLLGCLANSPLYAQSGLRESLERLDRNENGEIDPDEITPLSRPYLERVAEARRMSLERAYAIDKWQEAARIYYALQNGVAGKTVRPEPEPLVKGFGTDRDQPVVPEFGLAEFKYRYLQEDLDEADRTLRRSDRNKDGYIDRKESLSAKWTHRNPFEMDLDQDDRLSRLELAQRYARRRMLSGASDELVQRARRVGNGITSSSTKSPQREDDSSFWRRGGNRTYLTATILGRFDTNKNGRLDADEVNKLGIPQGRIDADRNGELSRDELFAYFADLQDRAGDSSEAVPGWFYELDANRDQQIEMMEFTEQWSDEKVAEFNSYDINGDGMLTTAEITQSKALVGGTYRNNDAEVLPPRKTIISEIEVDEDYLIGDLNVQISITHTYTSYLDAYLTGPDGERIELFTGVGRNDDHFDQTVFDDQSRYPITKARPPFKGTFMPEGLVNRQPGLSAFNGKSVKGVWQLVIRGSRSERFGMLHGWSLLVTPQTDLIDGVAPTPNTDGPEQIVSAAATPVPASPEQRSSGERRSDPFAFTPSQSGVSEKVQQAMGWQRQIVDQLKRDDIDPKEREGLRKKMEQIEKYKRYLESQSQTTGGTEDDRRKQIKADTKFEKRLTK